MNKLRLKSLEVSNFRSLRGHVHVPLDASVVLVHGENGAGKTSLLSAIELALTGRVQSFERADPTYAKQLVHRSAAQGRVSLETVTGALTHEFVAELSSAGARSLSALDASRADFFRERAFLPQSLLGQLLQIYQDAGSHSNSPLAQFVGKLLGLDRLDAIEAGLKPLADVRNVRKHVDGWLAAENDRSLHDSRILDLQRLRLEHESELKTVKGELNSACAELGLNSPAEGTQLDALFEALREPNDFATLAQLSDRQRQLASISRELEMAQKVSEGQPLTPVDADTAAIAFDEWQAEHGARVSEIRERVESVLPQIALPSEPDELARAALIALRAEHAQLQERVSIAREASSRLEKAHDAMAVAKKRLDTVEEELATLSVSPSGLGEALAQITAFIDGSVCPVCDRDYVETGDGKLADHVHQKVQRMSASAARLLSLGRTRSEDQAALSHWNLEVQALSIRTVSEQELASLDRRLALLTQTISEVEQLEPLLLAGAHLRATDVATRRALAAALSRDTTLAAARETLSDFARTIGAQALDAGETFAAADARLKEMLDTQAAQMQRRVELRRSAISKVEQVRATAERAKELTERISEERATKKRTEDALSRAQSLREEGNAIRNAVDTVRSAIIRREFNDRLNRLWRDLFVRLAPGEPFVPAFRIPASGTQNLQPKLVTVHRDGGDIGGSPGAMLSAGNLNTAALTLFTALHLSVPTELQLLILDDPVQSMDDVHIAHFAALLRTLSKEHGRQVMLAVHDRQLFEYLRLELSPAFAGDSLLTLELSRGPGRDSICASTRYSYQEETALLAA